MFSTLRGFAGPPPQAVREQTATATAAIKEVSYGNIPSLLSQSIRSQRTFLSEVPENSRVAFTTHPHESFSAPAVRNHGVKAVKDSQTVSMLLLATLGVLSDEQRCEAWCADSHCDEINGNVELECGGCMHTAHGQCHPDAPGYRFFHRTTGATVRILTESDMERVQRMLVELDFLGSWKHDRELLWETHRRGVRGRCVTNRIGASVLVYPVPQQTSKQSKRRV